MSEAQRDDTRRPSPGSLLSTIDHDPSPYYQRLHASGEASWDADMGLWLVASSAGCKHVMRNDKTLVRHAWPEMRSEVLDVIEGGERSLKYLDGDEHSRFHRWLVRTFSPNQVELWKASFIEPIVSGLLDDFAHDGQAELTSQFARAIPIRVIAAILGLPWEDASWLSNCQALLDQRLEFVEALESQAVTTYDEASVMTAMDELDEILLPYVRARGSSLGDDFLSRVNREGPTILDDWSENDSLAITKKLFFAGADTTAHTIANALYVICVHPEVIPEIAQRDEDGIQRFTEEMLRLYGATHHRPRLSNQDFVLGDAEIAKDEMLMCVLAAASRDPKEYEVPNEIRLDRDKPHDHHAFSFGPRSCAGSALARAEIQVALEMAIRRLPNLRLRSDSTEPATFRGFTVRSYRPLHVTFG